MPTKKTSRKRTWALKHRWGGFVTTLAKEALAPAVLGVWMPDDESKAGDLQFSRSL